jgi:hypothetical protein
LSPASPAYPGSRVLSERPGSTESIAPARTVKTNSRKITVVFAGLALGALAAGSSAAGTTPRHTAAGHTPPANAQAITVSSLIHTVSRSTLPAASMPASGARATAPRITLARYAAARHRARTPRQIARSMLPHFHWGPHQFKYLNWLWSHESGWNPYAANPYSGAYGIPQAMPGYQMASAGPGWHWNARTQIRWGMRYIRGRYGSPRRAWWHETGSGWY